jgi:hypothetical protein
MLFQRGNYKEQFLTGALPLPFPDGAYHGTVPGYRVSWLGKKFNATDHSGINLFTNGKGGFSEKYRFKTYTGAGLKDNKVNVVKIDYDIPENPFWLRWILDEIVEVTPGRYLGKMIIRLPGFSFAPIYFTLAK